MSAEIRVDRIKSRSGINTFSFTETGIAYGYHVGFGTTSPRANVDVEGNLIVTGGNAGIGTTVSTSRLNVIGDVRVSGVVTATSFVGDGTNLTNTGSTLSAASGSQRVVLTGQTSGTMTASATDAALTFTQSTGTLNATNLVVTGNVSVAGTVTSMDVTNVDSVGIITAQQGLQVLANGINVTGVSTLSGGVNASQGVDATGLRVAGITTLGQANITGLSNAGVSTLGNATASTLNVSGVSTVGVVTGATSIQATDFYGSGANLTGLAATANVTTSSLVVIGVSTVAAGTTAAPSITPTGDSNTGLFFPSADTIAFAEGGSEALRIDSSGNLKLSTAATSILNSSGGKILNQTGSILQVVQATKTDAFTTHSTTFTDVTGLSVSITPSSASSKVLLLAMIGYGGPAADVVHLKFLVGSTDLLIGDADSNRIRANFSKNNYGTESDAPGSHFTFLHSPASTSAQTYKVQIRSGTGSQVAVNRTGFDGNNSSYGRFASTMIAMEVAG